MNKFILSIALMLWLAPQAWASTGTPPAPAVRTQPTDIDALRRGYTAFVQNCQSCHALKLMRYNRVAEDLGLSEQEMRAARLIPSDAKIVDAITTMLAPDIAIQVYGVVPPDLSLTARARGVNWMHQLLNGFYQDSASKTGFNNLVMPNIAMPNMLGGKQGMQAPVYSEEHGDKVLTGVTLSAPGQLNRKQFYEYTRDIVSFLQYTAEPSILQRVSLGWWVIGFWLILLVFTYLLKREYWKDIH